MITPDNTYSITDLKRKTRKILNQLKETNEPIYVMDRSTPTAVMVEVRSYSKLIERIEDLEDMREMENVDLNGAVPLEEYDKLRTHSRNFN